MDNKDLIKSIFKESSGVKEEFLSDEANISKIAKAAETLIECYKKGGKVIVFGNGGSAADSQHLAAELLVKFEKERPPMAAIALVTDTSVLTATSNDYDFSEVFSRQVEALAGVSDVAVAISTSGNSPNVLEGAKKARMKKIPVIALTGRSGGQLAGEADISIIVKSDNTARIQEVHAVIIHSICKIVEDAFTG